MKLDLLLRNADIITMDDRHLAGSLAGTAHAKGTLTPGIWRTSLSCPARR